jgi:hypothetical protein
LYETWGYKNGFAERNDTDSFDEMAMKIENGARYIADTFDLAIVPVGMVWREIVNKHPEIKYENVKAIYNLRNVFYHFYKTRFWQKKSYR